MIDPARDCKDCPNLIWCLAHPPLPTHINKLRICKCDECGDYLIQVNVRFIGQTVTTDEHAFYLSKLPTCLRVGLTIYAGHICHECVGRVGHRVGQSVHNTARKLCHSDTAKA